MTLGGFHGQGGPHVGGAVAKNQDRWDMGLSPTGVGDGGVGPTVSVS